MRASSVFDGPVPAGWIYAADVRAKMLVCALASLMSIAVSNLEGQLVLVGASLLYALTLRRVGALLIAYALVALMTLMAVFCVWIMSFFLPKLMESLTFSGLIVPFLRILTMVHVVLPLALSSRIQAMLNALQSLRLPFWIYLPTAVVFRFLPTFWHDITQISESLRLRGYRITPWSLTRHPLLGMRLLFTPLLFRSLRSSEDLGIAAELKGLGYGGQITPYRSPVWKRSDTLLVAAAVLAAAAALTCQIFLGGGSAMP
ncbi:MULTISPECIES: energy-coupling factor transporter transmembrane protein EcfT [unclassified Desulfovibrio]|uniref:energy-coupling factor transporter transmembrane component T family protein n=1 Tax=unclassified Desulfovibrio TaxID=2593640 RepID=UPI000F5EE9A2|nr:MULTISPECIES: energy-coupling factor transporter transmembrane component T [unclassified Desulfovibrio]RRD69378.1 energy-coupling factor transporter transmembrane protein EcfT [Desulfovibrio sp. OH1209_COT-279]RRD86078.1 energy-coupling factor transporter transmembrane protein EcfT [Desulfovibrio sp. OH1186_COT-070]